MAAAAMCRGCTVRLAWLVARAAKGANVAFGFVLESKIQAGSLCCGSLAALEVEMGKIEPLAALCWLGERCAGIWLMVRGGTVCGLVGALVWRVGPMWRPGGGFGPFLRPLDVGIGLRVLWYLNAALWQDRRERLWY